MLDLNSFHAHYVYCAQDAGSEGSARNIFLLPKAWKFGNDVTLSPKPYRWKIVLLLNLVLVLRHDGRGRSVKIRVCLETCASRKNVLIDKSRREA